MIKTHLGKRTRCMYYGGGSYYTILKVLKYYTFIRVESQIS